MSIPGSVDNGEVDVEYSPDPDHRQSVQELWFRACDKRISALELQVHRLLNEQPQVPEADYAHIPAAEWEDICAELEALRTQQAQAPDVPMLQRMITALHKSGSESIEEIVRLSSKLNELRSQRPVMDSDGVTLSHDAYDALERQAAIGRSVPWKALVTTWLESEQGTPEWNALHEFTSKFGPSGPVEYMPNGVAE